MNRHFAQVMVDPENRRLVERRQQDAVELPGQARSRPNGFSTITRAPLVMSAFVSCSTTGPNITGGIAR